MRKRGVCATSARSWRGARLPTATGPAAAVNAVAATAFVARRLAVRDRRGLAQGDVGGPLLPACVYLAGGVFFCTGGYVSVLQVDQRAARAAGRRLRARPWRWWATEPAGWSWLSAFVLFVGTLVFAINLVDSFIADLTPRPGRPADLVAGHDRLRALPRLRPPGDGRDHRHLAAALARRAASAGGSSPSTSSARSSSWSPRSPPSSTPTAT